MYKVESTAKASIFHIKMFFEVGAPQFFEMDPQFLKRTPNFCSRPTNFRNGPLFLKRTPNFRNRPPIFWNGPPDFRDGPPILEMDSQFLKWTLNGQWRSLLGLLLSVLFIKDTGQLKGEKACSCSIPFFCTKEKSSWPVGNGPQKTP